MVLTGREKATIFLSILGADISSRILRYLPNELADLIAAGINHLPTPSPEALAQVMDEYQSFLALPESPAQSPPPRVAAPSRSLTYLMYERPQLIAFLASIVPAEQVTQIVTSIPKEKSVVEGLLATLKPTPLREVLAAGLKQHFQGKIF